VAKHDTRGPRRSGPGGKPRTSGRGTMAEQPRARAIGTRRRGLLKTFPSPGWGSRPSTDHPYSGGGARAPSSRGRDGDVGGAERGRISGNTRRPRRNMPQDPNARPFTHPMRRRGTTFAAMGTSAGRSHIAGEQARSDSNLRYSLDPNVFAVASRPGGTQKGRRLAFVYMPPFLR